MKQLFGNIYTEILFYISIFNSILFLISLILIIFQTKKHNRLKKRYEKFMRGLSDRNLEELIDTYLQKVDNINIKNVELENHLNHLEKNLQYCLQKVGIIRFNAFDDVGSDLSFAIALLNINDDGIVLSGIYSRDSSSTYAKPIIAGKSKYALSAEEIQAMELAKKSFRDREFKI